MGEDARFPKNAAVTLAQRGGVTVLSETISPANRFRA
jgi:hypothetical protein